MLKKALWTLVALFGIAGLIAFLQFQRVDTEVFELDEAARSAAPGSFVQLSGGMTHYELAGPDTGPLVVLVHGFSVPYYIWNTTFDHLQASGFRVLRFDLFGRGYSDRPDVDYNVQLFEQQILDLVDELGLQTPMHIVGLSMGGAVTMRFAAMHPESVNKIVLVDPSHQQNPPPAIPRPFGSLVIALTAIPSMADGQLSDFLHPERYPDWADRYRVQMQYKGFRRAITSTLYEFGKENHLANYATVQTHGLPVKLIWGVQDTVLDISGAATIKSVLDVDFMPVDQAGHLPHIEQADLVNSAIVDFLGASPRRED